MRMLADGEGVGGPEQRRARVRELLAVLAVHRRRRERAMDLLWPDLLAADAARNLPRHARPTAPLAGTGAWRAASRATTSAPTPSTCGSCRRNG